MGCLNRDETLSSAFDAIKSSDLHTATKSNIHLQIYINNCLRLILHLLKLPFDALFNLFELYFFIVIKLFAEL